MQTQAATQPAEGIASGILIDVTTNIRTSNGNASLFKAIYGEQIAEIWSDDDKPNPFLSGLSIGDTVRFHYNDRTTENEHGRKETRRYYTPLPAAK
tara:strand:- start:631 stop:918 length:288 start_codon:yes stop_codon:yes gene_type:complete